MVKLFRSWSGLLFLVLYVAGAISCSKQQPLSTTAISIVGFQGGSTFSGGVMVWGTSDSGKSFALSMSSEADSRSIELASGAWHFFAVGWTGENPLEGGPRCGSTDQVLSDGRASVSINLSERGCASSDFSTADYISGNLFSILKFITCADITDKTAGQNCDGASNKGAARSYKITFPDLVDGVVQPRGGLVSTCQNELDDAYSTITTTHYIPVGALGASPMGTVIEGFSLPDCDGQQTTFTFEQGLVNGTRRALVYPNGGHTEIFLQVALPAPLITDYTLATASYSENEAIAANVPTNDGGAATLWSISPELPVGLSFDETTGAISGTPTAASSSTIYTVIASNSTGRDSFDLDITVLALQPPVIEYSMPISFTAGHLITLLSPTITGGAVASFSISPELPAGLSLDPSSGEISGTPEAAQSVQSYTITAANSAGTDTQTINIQILAPATLSINSGPTYSYGVKAFNSSTDRTFTISNVGGVADATELSGADLDAPFSFKGGSYPGTGGDCSRTLISGQNCTIVVTYTPESTGPYADVIEISYNNGATIALASRTLVGTGVEPATLTISALDFGTVTTGSGESHAITVTKTGGVDATSVTMTLDPPFSFTGGSGYPGSSGSCGSTITASCTIDVTFTPTATTTYSETINFNYDNGASSQTGTGSVSGIGVSGLASAASLGITTALFADTGLGEASAAVAVTVTNSGGRTARSMSGVGGGNDFNGGNPGFSYATSGVYPGAAGTCGSMLNPGETCTLKIVFSPQVATYLSGRVTIQYYNEDGLQSAQGTLNGFGVRPLFGTGDDGDVDVISPSTNFSGLTQIDGIKKMGVSRGIVSVSEDKKVLTLNDSATDFSLGDEIMWIVTQAGTSTNTCQNHQGEYGFSSVIGSAGSMMIVYPALTLRPTDSELSAATSELTFCRIQVARVANLANLTIGANADTFMPGYNHLNGTGGVFAARVTGTLTLNGKIDMLGKGYVGGSTFGGAKGHSETGSGPFNSSSDASNNSMGGANGVMNSYGAAGGAGYGAGGNGGGTGSGASGGAAQNYCSGQACLPSQRLFMGGGGGAINSTARGGDGGGIIYIVANEITGSGSGVAVASGSGGGSDAYSGGGGGGGGSIYIQSPSFLGSWGAVAHGGSGGDAASFDGGGGGGGAVQLLYNDQASNNVMIDAAAGRSAHGASSGASPSDGVDGYELIYIPASWP